MATESELGSAVVPIRAKLDQLDKDLEQARQKIDSKLTGTMQSVGKKLGDLGRTAVLGGIGVVVAGVTAIGGAAFASGQEFDAAFDGVIAKTGATGARLEQLKADASAVFKSIPTDIATAADVVGTLNQRLGITGDTAQALAEQLILMGTDDAAKSTELYTRVMGDWSVKNEDAAATLDRLYKVSQLTGVGVDDLMGKVVQFGSPLRLMGFSLEESAAMFGKWEKEGVNAELVMGSLRIAAGKFAKENIPLKDGLEDTIAQIAGMTDESAALALGMQVFGARAGPDMVAAIREGRFELGDLTAAMQDSEGAIRSTAEATMDFPEKFQVLKNKLQTALAPVGGVIMDTLGTLAEKAGPLIERVAPLIEDKLAPAVEALGEGVGKLLEGDVSGGLTTLFGPETAATITTIGSALGTLVGWLLQMGGWLAQHQELIAGVVAALATFVIIAQVVGWISGLVAAIGAVSAAVGTAGGALGAIVAILGGPVTLAVAAVAAVVGLLVAAWTGNWFGIRDTLTAVWDEKLKPIFDQVVAWLQENIPVALQFLAGVWNNTLLPAIRAVWGFISEKLVPLLRALGNVASAVVGKAFEALAGLWQNVVMPALRTLWDWIENKAKPALASAAATVRETLGPAFQWLKEHVLDPVAGAFGSIGDKINGVIGWLNDLAGRISSLSLPDWLTPGSPTPLENGLRGIAAAMRLVSETAVPQLASGLALAGAPVGGGRGDVFNITINAPGGDPKVVKGAVTAGLMEVLRGRGDR